MGEDGDCSGRLGASGGLTLLPKIMGGKAFLGFILPFMPAFAFVCHCCRVQCTG